MNSAITIQNNVHLEKLLRTDPTMELGMRNAVKYVLDQARKDVVSDLSSKITNDPRHAVRAVRHTLYKQILGGNINILRKKRAGKAGSVPGSTRGRLKHTEQMLGYQGSDRGFILRFLNKGTNDRTATYMNAHTIRRGNISERPKSQTYQTSTIGGRGSILGQNFFGPAAQAAINEVLPILQQKFDELIQQQIQ